MENTENKKAFHIVLSNSITEIDFIDKKIEEGGFSFDEEIDELEWITLDKIQALCVVKSNETFKLLKALNKVGYKYQIAEITINDILDKININSGYELTELDKRILEERL